jgi:hypothetical protein
MYVCGARLYRANNVKTGSPTWVVVKDVIVDSNGGGRVPPEDHFEAVPPRNISTVAVAQGNENLVWVGYNNGQVWKTEDALAGTPTWERLDDVEPLPQRFVSKIVIDPNNHNRVYVSFMGWESDNVWRTTDGGLDFEEITGTAPHKLPSAPVGAFAQHPTKSSWLYAGTDVGLFTSSDDGQTWSTYTDGPGTVPMAELTWRNSNTLLAITHGRGVFSAAINAVNEPVSPRSFTIIRGIQFGPAQLQDLIESDDQRVVVRPGVVFTTAQPPVEVQIDAVAPYATTATLSASFESRASSATIGYTVYGWNFSSGQWVTLGSGSMTTTDTTVQVNFTNASEYIESGSRNMRIKIAAKADGPVFAYPWSFEHDKVVWNMPAQ